jgi:tetratricopeptide (TPR) repeat protein
MPDPEFFLMYIFGAINDCWSVNNARNINSFRAAHLRTRALICLAILFFASQQVFGAPSGLSALQIGQYATLEQEMNTQEAAFESGRITDVELLEYFRALYSSNISDEQYFLEWIRRYPQSYAAHVATGAFYKRVASEARGSQFASDTPKDKMIAMESYLAKADSELNTSLFLAAKPVIACLQRISVAQFRGDLDTAQTMLNFSIRVAPHNYIVRRKYMYVLQARWLGSVPMEKAFLADAHSAGLTPRQLQVLEGMELTDEGWVLDNDHKYANAWDHYKKGIALMLANPDLLELNCEKCLYGTAASIANDADDYSAGLKYSSLVLEIAPEDYDGHVSRAIALVNLKRTAEAIPDLNFSAQLGNSWAQQELASCCVDGRLKPNSR